MTFLVHAPIEGGTMAKGRYARLDKDAYNLPTRIPMDLYEWLRAYAHERRVSQNSVVVEALEALRSLKMTSSQETKDM